MRISRPAGQPERSVERVGVDSQTTIAGSRATPDPVRRPGDNPSQPLRKPPQTDRTPPDRPPRFARPHEHQPPRQNHLDDARSNPARVEIRRASGTKTVATARQPHLGRHPAPSADHVPPMTRDRRAHPWWQTTTDRESFVDREKTGNCALVRNPVQTGPQRIGLMNGADVHRMCRTPGPQHPLQPALPTTLMSAQLNVKPNAPDAVRKTRGYPRFNENAPKSARTDK